MCGFLKHCSGVRQEKKKKSHIGSYVELYAAVLIILEFQIKIHRIDRRIINEH
jgi:hypothetical protein